MSVQPRINNHKLGIENLDLYSKEGTKSLPNKKRVNIYLICDAYELLSDDRITTGNSKYRCTYWQLQKMYK